MLIALCVFLVINTGTHSVKVTEYKPSTQTQSPDDEDDCRVVMCSAFGGGIVGDTLALEFMSGD